MPHEMNDKELWQHFRSPRPKMQSCPDPVDLAALLDGRLNGDEKEQIEAHLADCPACLENYIAAQPTEDEALLTLPTVDWHNLAAGVSETAATTKTGKTAGRSYANWWKGFELLAASVIFIIISAAGYKAGYGTGSGLGNDYNSWLKSGNEIVNSTSLDYESMNFDLVEALLAPLAEDPEIEADYAN